ncbi:N-acetylmuramoyl-L-alanine amidase family protein [Clostridium sp. YIM B02551]|uniref:peptidoglycan recognition protein family protein n=1 Tax=Clostridium sp. YIM B02551 TaxID=2910679 RepID=UPI001EEBBEC8|nr:peptidoglycan recognition family protein [Clostridium sp. YIM B02551]
MFKTKKMLLFLLVAAFISSFFILPTNVQAVTVNEQFIQNNRSYQKLNPIGLVIHDTADPGATAQNEHDYFNRVYVGANAHYFVDWNGAIQFVPESEVGWHAGYTANHRYLSIEMCVPYASQEQFDLVYKNTVELAAQLCKKYGWNTNDNVFSHKYISDTYKETDHQDPYSYLTQYGKSWPQLLNDIQIAIDGNRTQIQNPIVQPSKPVVATQSSNLAGFSYANNAKVVGDDLYIRDENGVSIPGRYVSNGDNITVLDISYSKQLAQVEYPTPSGVRKGYVKNVQNLIKYYYQGQYANGSTSEAVYLENSLQNKFGSLDPREQATPLYRAGNKLCVVYSTSKGINTKNGFVDYNDHFSKF